MNLNLLLGRVLLLFAIIGTCNPCDAGFLIDGFVAPYGSGLTNASIGQSIDPADALGNKRVVNVTAFFDSNVELTVGSGTATYTVTATGTSPSASLTLSYSDSTEANSMVYFEAIVLSNVSSTSNWFLTVTMKGTNPLLSSTYSSGSPVITAGYNGELKIPLSQFTTSPSPFSMGPLSSIEFLFTTASAGQLSLGPMSITSVPEPAWLGLLCFAVPMCRRRLRQKLTKN